MQCVWISCWLSEWMRMVFVCRCDGWMDWLLRMGNDLHLLIIAFKLWVIQSWNSSITLRTHSISRWESIDDDGSSHQKSFVSIVHSRSFPSCSVSYSLFGGTISSARKIPVVAGGSESSLWKEFERVLLSIVGEWNSPVVSVDVDIVFFPTSNQPALQS